MTENTPNPHTAEVTEQLLEAYLRYGAINRIGEKNLPSEGAVVELLEELLALMYPGYHGRPLARDEDPGEMVARRLERLERHLCEVIASTLAFCIHGTGACLETCARFPQEKRSDDPEQEIDPSLRSLALRLTRDYLAQLPGIRGLLALDIQAAFEGDPAASSTEEVILCYPGVRAISVHRLAHPLFRLGVPLIPRIMSEWAHRNTGVDIHPGACIGTHFFIDHGTGVVIGETTRIGDHVKIYQGVTLGALSFARNPDGSLVKGGVRHPRIGHRVTIYASATILGGRTVIGDGAVIGGGAWITESVEPGAKVLAPQR